MTGGFKESALRLNAYFLKLNEWNQNHIKERAKQLADKDEKIWEYLKVSDAELASYKVEEKAPTKYTIDSYDLNAFKRMLYDKLDKRIMNLFSDVKREYKKLYKKLYIAYKLYTDFADIFIQKKGLRVSLKFRIQFLMQSYF